MAKLAVVATALLLYSGSLAHAGDTTTDDCTRDPRCYARELALTLTSATAHDEPAEPTVELRRVVDFAPGRVRVYSKSREKLQALVETWKHRSSWSTITVRGYATGNAELGQRRADKIRGYLIRYGVPAELVVASGEPGAPTVDLSIAVCQDDAGCPRATTAAR